MCKIENLCTLVLLLLLLSCNDKALFQWVVELCVLACICILLVGIRTQRFHLLIPFLVLIVSRESEPNLELFNNSRDCSCEKFEFNFQRSFRICERQEIIIIKRGFHQILIFLNCRESTCCASLWVCSSFSSSLFSLLCTGSCAESCTQRWAIRTPVRF